MQHARARTPVHDPVAERVQRPRFIAHLAQGGPRHWAPGADTFMEAALQFAEHVHDTGDEDLIVVVIDAETGVSERFNLGPHTQEVKRC